MNEYHSLVRETFVLRLWREATNPAWHGQIVHLPNQETVHFATLAEVEAFIRRFAPGVQVGQPPSSETAGLGPGTPTIKSSGGDEG